MPYLFLALGLIIGIVTLVRFFMKASPEQIKHAVFIATTILYAFVLLFFALTGRIIVSIILLIPAVMVLAGRYRKKK